MRRVQDRARSARSRKNGARSATIESRALGALKLASEFIILQFLPSNAPITSYNIRYWWFFHSQGNGWIKYRPHPKIRRPKSFQLTFAFLVALNGFHPLLSTQMTVDLTLECSDGSMFHLLSHTAWKNPFYCAETDLNSALNRRRVVVLDRLWANAVPISNRAFSCSNAHAKWRIHCLLISSRCQLSHTTLIYNRPEPFCGPFLCNQFCTIFLDGTEPG